MCWFFLLRLGLKKPQINLSKISRVEKNLFKQWKRAYKAFKGIIVKKKKKLKICLFDQNRQYSQYEFVHFFFVW